MESSLVIKVKYGDTLRRFNTRIDENGKLGFNVEQLREKMRSLFNLAVDDDFTLTYLDTDGDSVTIVEECDLDDVVLQRLNPVRMVLNLKTGEKRGSFNRRPSSRNSSSTLMDSSRIHQSIESIQASVENVVNDVPEPLRGVLLKLTRDVAATASAPVIADIIHSASKIGESFASQGSRSFPRGANVETDVTEGEISSGLPGSRSNANVEVKAKEINSGVCRVPDLNQAPPPTSGFAADVATPNACGSNSWKKGTHCPVFANGGSLNLDDKQSGGCPFSKTRADFGLYNSYSGVHRGPHFKQSHSHSDSVGPVSHTGVRCDGCNVHPITGPRFKSIVRDNYDLCDSCYLKSGNKADYVRIDSPMIYHHIMKLLHRKHGALRQRYEGYGAFRPIVDPFTFKPISPVNRVKLDSCFILDVNVTDGTMMAPSTPFTKIWKMQNNGNAVWPVGTQLVWTDGDKFSNALSVDLEISAAGVPVQGEIDVAVDFVAPELPGEYVSYWRMSSASGQKFGQKVWVSIQVDTSPNALSYSFDHLNLPPQSNGQNNPLVIDINYEPSMINKFNTNDTYPSEAAVKTVEGSSKSFDLQTTTDTPLVIEPDAEAVAGKGPMEDKDPNQESQRASPETIGSEITDPNLNFPINDFLLVGDAFSNGTASPGVPSVSYPVVDSKIIAGATASASSNVENLAPLAQSAVSNEIEELLIKKLSEMGFSQVDLNREILRKNLYDLEKTVFDLWDISEWDPIMEELEEMGFSDKKKNAILLVKNKGSLKRVVMDLVAGDQSQ